MSSRYDSGRDRGTNRGDRDRPRHDRSPPRRREGRSRSPRRDDYRDKDRDRRYGGDRDRDRRDYGRGGRDDRDDRRDRDRRDDRDTRDKRRDDKDRRDYDRDRPRDDRRDRDPPRRDAPRDRDRDGKDDRDRGHHSRPDDRRPPEGRDTPQSSRGGPPTAENESKSRQDSEVPTDGGEEGEAMDVTTVDDEAMMAMMGMSGFGSTKGKRVEGNQEGTVNIKKMRTWRQYMNRRGGFNRPLDKIK